MDPQILPTVARKEGRIPSQQPVQLIKREFCALISSWLTLPPRSVENVEEVERRLRQPGQPTKQIGLSVRNTENNSRRPRRRRANLEDGRRRLLHLVSVRTECELTHLRNTS